MLTPLDIQNKEFRKTLRGYDVKAVDLFLDEVIEDYEKIYKENVELKDKINLFSDQIRYYDTLEETLKNTLIIAQTTAEEVISTARQKSQNIIDESEINGDRVIQLAKEKVRNVRREYEYLQKEMFSFKTKYQSFMEAQLISLDKFYKEIEDRTVESVSELDLEKEVDEKIENISEEELQYLHETKDKNVNDLGA